MRFPIVYLSVSFMVLAGCQPDRPSTAVGEAQSVQPVVIRQEVEVIRTPTKAAFFGDLHVHTKNSFDALSRYETNRARPSLGKCDLGAFVIKAGSIKSFEEEVSF